MAGVVEPRSALGGCLSVAPVLLALVIAAVGCVAAARALSWLVRYRRFRRLELALPGPFSLPILGSIHLARKYSVNNALNLCLEMWGGRYSELSRIAVFNNLFVFVTDPDHLAKVMRDKRLTDKPWFIYSPLRDMIGNGIFTSNGSVWQKMRSIVTPTFHLELLDNFVDVFAEEAEVFAQGLASMRGKDIEFTEEMVKTTSIVAIRTILSTNFVEHDKEDLDEMVAGIMENIQIVCKRSFQPWLWPDSIFRMTSMHRKQKDHEAVWARLMGRLIKRKTQEITSRSSESQLASKLGFKEHKTFLDLLLQGKLAGEIDMTEHEILTETKTMFGTAIDSPVIVLGFVLKVLSIRSDIKDKVEAEIHDVLQSKDKLINNGDLPRLQYMERVIKETLRMFPVGPLTARRVNEDLELDGKLIPAGSALVLNTIGAHRDPRHHENPLIFDPDRFLPERFEKLHPFSYFPFSAGPRNCVGQQYAMMLMKTLLSTILRAYRVLPVDDGVLEPSQIPITFDVMIRYVGGVKLRFEPRVLRL